MRMFFGILFMGLALAITIVAIFASKIGSYV